ncbi:hypothetical protein [Halococcus sp. IIIV-5B]|uniref:hypothetical protein n=1 Tax=Halococcus sp. IIIV-5B TaxID=2321230 RepID=UPI0011C37F85|nr:hypothetical protein [Halococcus sp. IIIV-5B]
MPAKRTYHPRQFEDNLAVSVNGDLERRKNVYFTDQSPTFEIVIENTGEVSVEVDTFIRLSFEESRNKSEWTDTVDVNTTVDPGDTETYQMNPEMLPYQGSGAVSLESLSLYQSDSGRIGCRRSSSKRPFRLYTFMVYDRDYYRVEYLRPRLSQYASMVLSILIVALAVIQLWLA